MNQQPEALRLAEILMYLPAADAKGHAYQSEAATELRRLYEENEALRKDAERRHLLILSVEEAMKNGVLPIDVEAAYAAMKGQS